MRRNLTVLQQARPIKVAGDWLNNGEMKYLSTGRETIFILGLQEDYADQRRTALPDERPDAGASCRSWPNLEI
jgi:hypothetical protein